MENPRFLRVVIIEKACYNHTIKSKKEAVLTK